MVSFWKSYAPRFRQSIQFPFTFSLIQLSPSFIPLILFSFSNYLNCCPNVSAFLQVHLRERKCHCVKSARVLGWQIKLPLFDSFCILVRKIQWKWILIHKWQGTFLQLMPAVWGKYQTNLHIAVTAKGLPYLRIQRPVSFNLTTALGSIGKVGQPTQHKFVFFTK